LTGAQIAKRVQRSDDVALRLGRDFGSRDLLAAELVGRRRRRRTLGVKATSSDGATAAARRRGARHGFEMRAMIMGIGSGT
jgi:hypothetical protein